MPPTNPPSLNTIAVKRVAPECDHDFDHEPHDRFALHPLMADKFVNDDEIQMYPGGERYRWDDPRVTAALARVIGVIARVGIAADLVLRARTPGACRCLEVSPWQANRYGWSQCGVDAWPFELVATEPPAEAAVYIVVPARDVKTWKSRLSRMIDSVTGRVPLDEGEAEKLLY